jgi:hypothetical protein
MLLLSLLVSVSLMTRPHCPCKSIPVQVKMLLILIHLSKPLSKLLGVVESNNMASFNKSMKNTIPVVFSIVRTCLVRTRALVQGPQLFDHRGWLTTMMMPAYLPR